MRPAQGGVAATGDGALRKNGASVVGSFTGGRDRICPFCTDDSYASGRGGVAAPDARSFGTYNEAKETVRERALSGGPICMMSRDKKIQ